MWLSLGLLDLCIKLYIYLAGWGLGLVHSQFMEKALPTTVTWEIVEDDVCIY